MSQYLSITNTKQRELTESHKTNMCLCNYIVCGLQKEGVASDNMF